MSSRNLLGAGRPRVLAAVAAVVVAALAVAAVVVLTGHSTRTVTAYFGQTVGLFPGDEVRVLGVPVGRVEDVVAEGDKVRAELSYDADEAPLPADATAAVIAPTLVSVRYVQLGPVVRKDASPQLADGATIPIERTAEPIEWDSMKTELDKLTAALGPKGADKDGALSRLITTTSDNLRGQGQAINDSIDGLSRAFDTLNGGGADLFATVRNLQVFTKALQDSDDQVAGFNRKLADVSTQLNGNGEDLKTLLSTIDRTSATVEAFVADNRDHLASSTASLAKVTGTLSRSRQALADVLQRAPIALSNLHNIYDPFSGGVTASLANSNVNDPGQFACGAAFGAIPGGPDNPQAIQFCHDSLGPLLDAFRMPSLPVQTTPVERDTTGVRGGTPAVPGNIADLVVPGGDR